MQCRLIVTTRLSSKRFALKEWRPCLVGDVDTVLTSVSDETHIRQMPAGFLPRNALVASSGCHFSEAICLATEIDHSSMVLFPDGANRRVGHPLRREGNISCQTHTLPSVICEHTRIQGYSCDVLAAFWHGWYLQHCWTER